MLTDVVMTVMAPFGGELGTMGRMMKLRKKYSWLELMFIKRSDNRLNLSEIFFTSFH
jgi:hypothetical protein